MKRRWTKLDGLSKSLEYKAWHAMKNRCGDRYNSHYHRYGGRGIKVCPRWQESFLAFIEDMGRKPSPELSLDRIDNDGVYEPGNCRWATRQQQAANKHPAGHSQANGLRPLLLQVRLGDEALEDLATLQERLGGISELEAIRAALQHCVDQIRRKEARSQR
jgi:hypothetical protein